MPTQYTNSLSYLQARNLLEAEKMGYLNNVLYGAQLMGMLPMVPANDWMQDIQMRKIQATRVRSSVRLLNEAPDLDNTNRYAKDVELTAIYTTPAVGIDKRLARQKPQLMDMMMQGEVEDLMLNINYDIVNGSLDATGRGINGFKQRIPIGSPWDVDQAAGLNITTQAGYLQFLKVLRKAQNMIKKTPTTKIMAICNEDISLGLSSGRDLNGAAYMGTPTVDIANDRVEQFDNIPFVVLRGNSIGTETLPFDEQSNTATSIYLVAYDTGVTEGSYKLPGGVSIITNDSVVVENAKIDLTQYIASSEIELGLRTPDRSLIRLSGLKVA